MARSRLACVFALCLLGKAFTVPVDVPRLRRGFNDNELDSDEITKGDSMSTDTSSVDERSQVALNPAVTLPPVTNTYEDKRKEFQASSEDDDDDFPGMQTSATAGGGSNIISLLNLVNGLFPSAGGPNFQAVLRSMIRRYLRRYPQPLIPPNKVWRRQGIFDNEIDIDDTFDLKHPPFLRQESDENGSESNGSENDSNGSENGSNGSESDSNSSENDSNGSESDSNASETREDSGDSDEDNAAEESMEEQDEKGDDDDGDGNVSVQDTDSKPASDGNGDSDEGNDSDYDDEPPGGGDGQGGGILGILAGLSGDDGQSDLGSLLATISGIVVSLSGDGIDVNSLIASGIGLFVGLLSEGEENPGSILASYLLTSLETITGGGSKNNGAFFGKFISKLISGTSAGEAPEGASDESGEPEGMKDSAGFVLSLLMGLSGDMSKTSSAGSSKPW